jgi:hypothetical protein
MLWPFVSPVIPKRAFEVYLRADRIHKLQTPVESADPTSFSRAFRSWQSQANSQRLAGTIVVSAIDLPPAFAGRRKNEQESLEIVG